MSLLSSPSSAKPYSWNAAADGGLSLGHRRNKVPLDLARDLDMIDAEHFRSPPRNKALTESLSLISEGREHSTPRVIGFETELRNKKGLQQPLSVYAEINEHCPATWLIMGNIRAGTDRQIFEEFRQLHTRARIIVTGYVSRRDLPIDYVCWMYLLSCGIVDAVKDCRNGRLVSTNNRR